MSKICTVGPFLPLVCLSLLPAPEFPVFYPNNVWDCLTAVEQSAFQTGSCTFAGMWVKESFCQDEQPDCKAPALRMLAAILNSSTDLFQWALNKYWTAEVKKKKKK